MKADQTARGLHRVIAITVSPAEARGIVSDDFHQFRVAVRHRAGVITHVASQSARMPFTLCPAAGERLTELVGLPLSRRVTDIHGRIDGRQQCTHQFDLAALAIAAAARGSGRTYQIFVTDPVDDVSDFSLLRDDGVTLEWRAERGRIISPSAFAGIDLRHGFTDWVAKELDEDLGEAALVLRRAHMVSNGRQITDELNKRAHAPPKGGCWVQQPERAEQAKRLVTHKRDGLTPPERDADDEAWLGFR